MKIFWAIIGCVCLTLMWGSFPISLVIVGVVWGVTHLAKGSQKSKFSKISKDTISEQQLLFKGNIKQPLNISTQNAMSRKTATLTNNVHEDNSVSSDIIMHSKLIRNQELISKVNVENSSDAEDQKVSLLIEINIADILKSLKDNKPLFTDGQTTPSIMTNNESIIDITGQSISIESANNESIPSVSNTVPYWGHSYIYNTSDLSYASEKVKKFYSKYKDEFSKGNFYDLEGSTNYSFTLMFDFLNEYQKHQDLSLLTQQMQNLMTHYPETASYAQRNLINKAREADRTLKRQKQKVSIDDIITLFPDAYEWTFVDKYSRHLNLTKYECELLDFFNSRWDSFYSNFEFLKIKHVELFRNILSHLNSDSQSKSFDKEAREIAKLFKIDTNYRYYDYNSYRYGGEMSLDDKLKEIYNCVFRLCKNILYSRYGFNSEVDVYFALESIGWRKHVTALVSKIEPIIKAKVEVLPPFTDEEEIIVNNSYTTRWRSFYKDITDSYDGNITNYLQQVERLAALNKENFGQTYLLFDASKFLTDKDNISALKMYIRYIEVFSTFSSDEEKPLPKYICKKLFKPKELQGEFESIINNFKKDKDRGKAFSSIDELYLPKRKKLNLDSSEIRKIAEQHSDMVKLLDEAMAEEQTMPDVQTIEENFPIIMAEPIDSSLNITLDSEQIELLDIFVNNNYIIQKTEVEAFAKSKNLMPNRLIEKINEMCYDILDDVLIEEEDDNWSILEDYLKKILVI